MAVIAMCLEDGRDIDRQVGTRRLGDAQGDTQEACETIQLGLHGKVHRQMVAGDRQRPCFAR